MTAPLNHETWLVCGGRDFSDQKLFDEAMEKLVQTYGKPKTIVHGNANGADTMAGKWGQKHSIIVIPVKAKWKVDGKYDPQAGPKRNKKMLDDHQPQKVIAFPGGPGTANMIMQAKARQFTVCIIENIRDRIAAMSKNKNDK